MPKMKELTVTIADQPGALGTCFQALANRGINILAFQSYVEEGESLARLVVDDPVNARAVLGTLGMLFEVTEVAAVRLANQTGQLARAAVALGEGGSRRERGGAGEKDAAGDRFQCGHGLGSFGNHGV